MEGKNAQEINGKRRRLMDKWLDVPQRFRSPVAATKRREGEGVEEFVQRGGIT